MIFTHVLNRGGGGAQPARPRVRRCPVQPIRTRSGRAGGTEPSRSQNNAAGPCNRKAPSIGFRPLPAQFSVCSLITGQAPITEHITNADGGRPVRHHGVSGWMLVGCLAATAAISAASGAEDENRPAPRPEVDGTWTPLVTLRDTTDQFPGDNRIRGPRTAGGWRPSMPTSWPTARSSSRGGIAPWRSSAGTTRAASPARRSCSTSSASTSSSPTTLEITPLDEQPRRQGDVLYCAGHAPLADGRILFMGGARYQNLGVAGFPGSQGPTREPSGRRSSA